ncbi:ATP-binding protein [Hornefia butyriciproducens]|uniref:ATP-binding protein n=1 Tax=Hornefia butyriciproducens TaxID=2652293 RepID=UPI003F8BC695
MSKKYRLILMLLSIITLLSIGFFFYRDFSFVTEEFWFTSGLLLLVLLSLIDQPHYSTDSNIFVNSITGFLSLLLIPPSDRNVIYILFVIWTLYLGICSYIILWKRKNALNAETNFVQFFSRLNREIGKPEVIFSAFFFWAIVSKFGLSSEKFNALFCFWVVFMILNVPVVAKTIEGIFDKTTYIPTDNMVGTILGVQAKNIFLIKLIDNRKVKMHLFDFVQFRYSMDNQTRYGIVVDVYNLDQAQWIKVLYTKEISEIFGNEEYNGIDDVVYKVDTPTNSNIVDRLVGIVSENSTIEKIRFIYNSKASIEEGELVEIYIGNHKVLYQIVQGITCLEQLENKNSSGYITGEAIQLGEWSHEKGSFNQFGWVPNINTPVFLSSSIEEPEIEENEVVIGRIPNTNYPVILNKETAVTHHTAILGVTGAGKSVFARKLINEIAADDTKVIIVDLTGEYQTRFENIHNIVSEQDAGAAFGAIETIALEKAKFANQQDQKLISNNENVLKRTFYSAIKDFLGGADNKAIFEIPDISNNANVLEYTRWFFFSLFKTAKTKKNFGKRVCVVLEEAHTIIPEVNAMGVSDYASRATVNSIAQIALQGRKYNIGFIVIAQRTANVSKTVLTQCNSIIAFQELDKTSNEFLSSYLGQEYIRTLSSLKFKTAIATGKAFRSTAPMIFEVPNIKENMYEGENSNQSSATSDNEMTT